ITPDKETATIATTTPICPTFISFPPFAVVVATGSGAVEVLRTVNVVSMDKDDEGGTNSVVGDNPDEDTVSAATVGESVIVVVDVNEP
ncbi:hypothetical protein C0991_006985, partial [Blastosporella zonata]